MKEKGAAGQWLENKAPLTAGLLQLWRNEAGPVAVERNPGLPWLPKKGRTETPVRCFKRFSEFCLFFFFLKDNHLLVLCFS